MKIQEKIKMDRALLEENGAITIVVFGDSVSHGAVAPGVIDYENVYWNRLRKKILSIRNYVPVNVINSAIGGTQASNSLKRFDKQVLKYDPDLVILCFGLNDVNNSLEEFISSIRYMIEKCKENGIDVVFMTPNMLNTYVHEKTAQNTYAYAHKTAEYQNSGKMDLFMESAVKLCRELDVLVCDCYSDWKKLAKTEDTTLLLANYINHPISEMHELFASKLFETLFPEYSMDGVLEESTMYK